VSDCCLMPNENLFSYIMARLSRAPTTFKLEGEVTSFRELTGRSQLWLIETLFRDPSDVTLSLKDWVRQVPFLVSCPKGQVEKYVNVAICQYFTNYIQIYQGKIHIVIYMYMDFRGRSDFSFRELTGRSGETSGRSQLWLIETLFRDPSDVILPKFSK
jgi:hypothetical protein